MYWMQLTLNLSINFHQLEIISSLKWHSAMADGTELQELGMNDVHIDVHQVNGSNKKSGRRKSLKPNKKLKHETVKSISIGDTEQVREWVNSLPQTQRAELINQHTDTEGRKALHIACLHNQLEVTKILLEAGADPNIEDHEQRTALHCACSNQHVHKEPTTVQELRVNNFERDATEQEGSTTLDCDVQESHHHSDVVELLLAKGAKLEVKDKFGLTPVHRATGDVETLEVLTRRDPTCVHYTTTSTSQTLLHYAAEKGYSEAVELLLKKGADIEARDKFGLTPVHWATGDVKTLQVFIDHNPECIHYTNPSKSTPLHYAAEKGHSDSVTLLLKNGADMTARDKDGLAPIHWATGDVKTLKVMIKDSPQCVSWTGDDKDKETPLHFAAYYGHTEGAEKLLESNSGLVHVTNKRGKQTPLHYAAAYSKDPRLAKVLLNHGADAKALDWKDRDPLHIACQYGNIGVVKVFKENGVKVEAKHLQVAVKNGNQRIVRVLLYCPNWLELLRQTYTLDDGTETTPFREMIKTMPDIAEEILNKCTIINPENNDPTNKDYEAIFNYEFIEDFRDSEDSTTLGGEDDIQFGGVETAHHDVGTSEGMDALDKKRLLEEKKKFGITFAEVKHRQNNSVSWGPVGFSMSNHPLAIMAKRSPKLLTHPLVRSALHYKWKMFGQYAYYTNLFTYLLFLIFLTTFALLVPNPQTDECATITGGLNNTTTAANPVECRSSKSVQAGVYISAGIVILSALCRILLEVLQLIIYKLDYITDWVNWSELVMYVSSIIFVWVFNTQCQCPYNWQWQIGVVAIFLGWFNLVLFSSKFPPFGGIYVLMFVKIIKTFLKICILSFLLVLAFALTFYMAFYEPSISRSPFSHPGRSILKTMSMTTGDYSFDSIFRQDPTGGGDTLDEIPFPPISYIMWVVFIVLMPILLNNMLVGLAVGDTQSILKEAAETKLALQVEQVLTTEETLRKCFMCVCHKFRWNRTKYSVFPNKSSNFLKDKLKKMQFSLWGGDPYNPHVALQRATKRLGDQGKNNGQKDRDYDYRGLSKQVYKLKNQLEKIEEIMDKLVQGVARNTDVVDDLAKQSAKGPLGHTRTSNL